MGCRGDNPSMVVRVQHTRNPPCKLIRASCSLAFASCRSDGTETPNAIIATQMRTRHRRRIGIRFANPHERLYCVDLLDVRFAEKRYPLLLDTTARQAKRRNTKFPATIQSAFERLRRHRNQNYFDARITNEITFGIRIVADDTAWMQRTDRRKRVNKFLPRSRMVSHATSIKRRVVRAKLDKLECELTAKPLRKRHEVWHLAHVITHGDDVHLRFEVEYFARAMHPRHGRLEMRLARDRAILFRIETVETNIDSSQPHLFHCIDIVKSQRSIGGHDLLAHAELF